MATRPHRAIPNVGRALTQAPESLHDVKALAVAQYVPVQQIPNMGYDPGRAIDRVQMELVAARVAAINQCFY